MNSSVKKYSLAAGERIKSRKDFEKIFIQGQTVLSSDRKLKAVLYTESKTPGTIKMAAAVSRKAGISVWRNRIKRLIKESYRLNKEILTGICQKKNIEIHLVISPYSLNQNISSSIKKADLDASVIDLLNKARKII